MKSNDAAGGHDVPKCGAVRRSGGHCQQPAGWGTDHLGIGTCKLHLGCTANAVKHAERIMAEQAVRTFGLPREIGPTEALAEELWRTAGVVAWLDGILGDTPRDQITQRSMAGVRPSVWVEMYWTERRHYAAVARECVKAGLEERRVALHEEQVRTVGVAIRSIVEGLGHRLDDPEVVPVVERSLRLIAGGQAA